MRSKTDERRQRIVEIAREAFQELGYKDCSMNEITARVGGSKATLYNYFPSKEALFAEVMLRARASVQDLYRTLVPGAPAEPTLRALGRRMLPLIMSEGVIATMRLAHHEASRSDAGRVLYEAGAREGLSRLAAFLEEAMARGELRQADPEIATFHVVSLLQSEHLGMRLAGVIGPPTLDEIELTVDRAIDVFMAAYGLRPVPGRTSH